MANQINDMVTLAVLSLAVLAAAVNAQIAPTQYVLALLGQDIQYPGQPASDTQYEVVLTNPGIADADVNITDVKGVVTTIQVAPGASKYTAFQQEHSMNGSELANKSIIFSAAKSFTLQVFIRTTEHAESFLGIPVSDLGTDYHVSSFCPLGGYCQIIIAAAEAESTYVHLRIPSRVSGIVFCVGKKFFRSERDTQFTLEPYEAVQVESASDLTGTFIYSSKKVSVFVGTRNMTLEGKVTLLAEQLQPGTEWGSEFILETLGENEYGDVIQITARTPYTGVTMKGFPNFVLTDFSQTAHRRLDMGMNTHIKANQSIQVIQITGITYATAGETPDPAMAVVPAVSRFSRDGRVSCGAAIPADGEFHVVMAKLDTEFVEVDSTTFIPNDVHYTDFAVGTALVTAKDNYPVTTSGDNLFGGILKCSTGGAMPLGFGTSTTPITSPLKSCDDGKWTTTTYELGTSTQMVPHRVTIATRFDVIKLRVKSCGTAIVQLYKDDGVTNDHVMLRFYKSGSGPNGRHIKMDSCIGGTCTKVDNKVDSYNTNLADCNTDMGFYWIRLDATALCCGAGPLPDPACGADTVSVVTGWKPVILQMFGLMKTATFSYDFEAGNCDRYNSDWRCQDVRDDCHTYSPDICTTDRYCTWVDLYCRKYCGKCSPDNFGRKFAIVVPKSTGPTCSIIVTPEDEVLGDIAVGAVAPSDKKGVLPATTSGGTRHYDCASLLSFSAEGVVIVVSERDVAVTVLMEAASTYPFAYPVYPVDAIGDETMSLTNCGMLPCTCALVAVDYDTTVTTYIDTTNTNTNWVVNDVTTYTVTPDVAKSFMTGGGDFYHKAVLFKSERPVYVYCGTGYMASFALLAHFNHILPTNTYGTKFVTPAFDTVPANRPFDATLFLQANHDNTLITIDGDFQAIYAIFIRGNFIEKPIDAATIYTVTSNYPITIGLKLVDSADATKGGFYVLPPARNFPTTTTSTPSKDIFHSMDFTFGSETTYYVDAGGNSATTGGYAMTVELGANGEWFLYPGPTTNTLEMASYCPISDGTPCDLIDNDCDGLVDEDKCFSGYGVYGQDTDMDGGFGEDCCGDGSGTPVVSEPAPPTCIPIMVEGWTICTQCPCTWVEELERREKLTEEERQAEAEADISKYKDALKVDTETLVVETSKKVSAGDQRQSAANIGYLGIAMFAVIFGGLFLMDLTSLLRDFYILKANVSEGFHRLSDCLRRR